MSAFDPGLINVLPPEQKPLASTPNTAGLAGRIRISTLDDFNLDLGGTAPLPIDVPLDVGESVPYLLQFGKDGKGYLLDRSNLGGMDGALVVQPVANGEIITGPAIFPATDGVYVAIGGNGANCPVPGGPTAVTMLKVSAQPVPAISTVWCASLLSTGSPTVTTTDDSANPVVWMASTNGDRMLHAWTGDTGQLLFNGGGFKMSGIPHFAAVLAAEGHLFVGGGRKVYEYTYLPNQ